MSLVKSCIHERILHVAFSDSTSRNSFSVRAANELASVLDLHLDQFDGLVFSAVGRVFCSGGNLSDYAAMTDPEHGKSVNRRITDVLDRLARIDKPTACVVTGDCFGGGIELMSAFDVVFSVPHAVYGFWQRRIGLSFGWGGGARIESRIGTHSMKRLALSAANLSAREALGIRLIDFIVPETLILGAAESCVRSMSSLPQAPVGPMKAWSQEREMDIFEALWWNEEHRRVLEKRK